MTLSRILGDQVLGIFTRKAEIVEIEGVVDLYSDEVHEIRVSKTSHPIESGSSITDNSVVEPQRLRMSGFVSNLVLAEGVSLPAPERGKEAWSQLVALAKKREPVTIVTMLQVYENFLIVGITADQNESTGLSLPFSIDFEEIQFADSEFTTLPANTLSAGAINKAGTVEGGIKQAGELSPADSESVLSQIKEGFSGFF